MPSHCLSIVLSNFRRPYNIRSPSFVYSSR
jgi:hypothetical protein